MREEDVRLPAASTAPLPPATRALSTRSQSTHQLRRGAAAPGTRALCAGALALGLLTGVTVGAAGSAALCGAVAVLTLRLSGRRAMLLLLLGWFAGSTHGTRILLTPRHAAPPRWVEGQLTILRAGLPGRRGIYGQGSLRPQDGPPLRVDMHLTHAALRRAHPPVPGAVFNVAGRLDRRAGRRPRLEIPANGRLRLVGGATRAAREIRAAREWLDARLARRLNARDRGLLRALLLGDRGALTYQDRLRMRRTGQAHLLAVSGLHVALMAAGLSLLLTPLRLPPPLRALLVLVAVTLHVHLAGTPPSAVRAGVGVGLVLFCRWTGRVVSAADILAALVLLVFAGTPQALADPALQLSLLAIAGILLLTPSWRALLAPAPVQLPGLARPRSEPWRLALCAGLGAWCATAPLVAARLGQLTCLGAPLALVCMPVVTGLMIIGAVQLVVCDVPFVGDAVGLLVGGVADALRALLDLILASGLGAVDTTPPSLLWTTLWLLALLALLSFHTLAMRCGALAIAVLATIACPPPPATSPGLAPGGGVADTPPYDAWPPTPPDAGMDPLPLAIISAVLLAFGVVSARPPLRFLTAGGGMAASGLGILTAWRFGAVGLAALFAPFIVASLLGRLPGAIKSPPRTVKQVLANGLPAALGALLHLLGAPGAGTAMFLGGLAALGADTCATEIGTRYGGTPRRLLHREALATGMSGGVTRMGFLGALGGACLAPGVTLAAGTPLGVAITLALCGFAGAVIDSALGDTVQYRGLDPETGAITEKPMLHGKPSEPFSGYRWLDNDAVNLVAGIAAGALAVILVVGLGVGLS